MPSKNIIVVVVDRLHAGMLGAYGNTWIRTAHFDELASQSFLFDQAIIESPRLDAIYRAFWLGETAAAAGAPASAASFPQLVNSAGWHTALITDERELVNYPAATAFAEQTIVNTPDVNEATANVSDTQLARLFMTATEWFAAAREPFCLWLHARHGGALGCAAGDAPAICRRGGS